MPSPPICIKHKITHFPNKLQYVAVFLTTRPVTHVAEVDVNKASLKDVAFPFACEIGSISSSVPKSIRNLNECWGDFLKKVRLTSFQIIILGFAAPDTFRYAAADAADFTGKRKRERLLKICLVLRQLRQHALQGLVVKNTAERVRRLMSESALFYV